MTTQENPTFKPKKSVALSGVALRDSTGLGPETGAGTAASAGDRAPTCQHDANDPPGSHGCVGG